MTEQEWRRLDPKTVLAVAVLVTFPLIPTIVIMLVTGVGPTPVLITAGCMIAAAVLITSLGGMDWYFTWYRVTEERFELHKGGIFRSRRWIPRDRIRSVDLTADPVHRLLKVSVVKIGTGESGESELKLDSLSRSRAELLRQELLHAAGRSTGTEQSTVDGTRTDGVLASLKPAWFGYSALTVSLLAVVWGAIGSAYGSFHELIEASGFLATAIDWFRDVPLWMTIVGGALTALVGGMLGAVLLSVEMWWGFTLTRERNTALRVRRGLLTTRSVTLEERRLRGVEVAEPMLLRWAGGARTNAVATGLSEQKDGKPTESKTLLPPAPRAEAQRVAAATLRETHPPTEDDGLVRHPRAAFRRRMFRAMWAVAPIVLAIAVVALLGWAPWWVPCVVALVGVVAGAAVARDAYRNLGHRLAEKYLISRRGSAVRRTVALRRDGIIGWRMRQSWFQRRADLMSVAATTAAGNGVYEIPDVATESGLALADEAIPGLLAPFLEYR